MRYQVSKNFAAGSRENLLRLIGSSSAGCSAAKLILCSGLARATGDHFDRQNASAGESARDLWLTRLAGCFHYHTA